MKWSKLRELYPNKFVLVESISENIEGNYKYVDEVDFIRIVDGSKPISKILSLCSGNRFVYHTSNEEICIEIVRNIPLRMRKNC